MIRSSSPESRSVLSLSRGRAQSWKAALLIGLYDAQSSERLLVAGSGAIQEGGAGIGCADLVQFDSLRIAPARR